jgi:hypothetical protein
VSDEIKNSFKSARSGNYSVRVSDHILLLNWNSQTPAVLRQLTQAQAKVRRRGGVVWGASGGGLGHAGAGPAEVAS